MNRGDLLSLHSVLYKLAEFLGTECPFACSCAADCDRDQSLLATISRPAMQLEMCPEFPKPPQVHTTIRPLNQIQGILFARRIENDDADEDFHAKQFQTPQRFNH